ncbi:universal stress protein [Shumkonia mesophila]|uniref:universal stress protein n=1 Tax=Shumkonia mesophila TaxID=2838854 RepID=UPI00293426DB|nr:universal stress protein [Shumkonia mesophila]
MKTILLPLVDDDSATGAIETTFLIAQRFGSYIEGLFVRAPLPVVSHGPVPPHFLGQYRDFWDQNAERARRRFAAFMNERNVPFREIAVRSDQPTAWWREQEGERDAVVGSYGRLFRLIVICRTPPEVAPDWMGACEAALFYSGRPVVVSSGRVPETVGETVVVAWNGSTETARTLALGWPILRGARSIHVLSVSGASGGMVAGPSGEEVAAHMAREGLNATARTVPAKGRSAGTALLAEAHALGADLLVKGAFTRSRLQQMIFGGTTRQILAEADIPVLIAH